MVAFSSFQRTRGEAETSGLAGGKREKERRVHTKGNSAAVLRRQNMRSVEMKETAKGIQDERVGEMLQTE
jgi:hypothetical protein